MKEIPVHRDILGRDISIDEIVAFSHHNQLKIGKVIKLNPKMLKIKEFRKNRSWGSGEYNIYSSETVIIPGADAVIYILQQA
jgi:hypothetical protein